MKLGLSLGTLAALQLVASFALQLLVLALLGAGSQTDAWVAAQAVPLVVFSVVSVALQSAWQSRLAVVASEPETWNTAQRAAQGQLILVFGVIALVLIATAHEWASRLFPGFSSEQVQLTTRMTRVLLLGAVLNGQAGLLTTAPRGRGQFLGAEVISLAGSGGTIALVAVTVPIYGVEAAAWCSVARSLLVYGTLFWMANCPLPSVMLAWADKERWAQMRPVLLGSTVYKTGPLVDRFWSSHAPAGGMTTFNLIQTGMGAVASVLDRAFCTPAAPELARLASINDFASMNALYRKCVIRVGMFTALLLVSLVALYPFWPDLAHRWLTLDRSTALQAWLICILLVGYLFPAAAGSVVAASFYAIGDTRTPVKVGMVGFAVSLALKAICFLSAGLAGLALATAAHYLGNMLVMCWLLGRKLKSLQRH